MVLVLSVVLRLSSTLSLADTQNGWIRYFTYVRHGFSLHFACIVPCDACVVLGVFVKNQYCEDVQSYAREAVL